MATPLPPTSIRKVLLLVSKRADKIAGPLRAVGVESEAIIASKWEIVPKVLAREDAIRAAGVDLVISDCCGTHASMAMMLRGLLGVPAVFRMRGNMWDEYEDRRSARDSLLRRKFVDALVLYTNHNLPRMDAIMPVARHMADAVRAELPGIRTPVLPIPISVTTFPPAPDDRDALRARWSPDGRGIVASITNLRYWQKAAPMLDAAPALEEVLREHGLVWAIAGRGAFADQFFEELAKRCSPDLWVRAGFVSDPWSLLYAASAFLHISEMDGMPNVVIEAQSCGCPVIANDHPAMAELIRHGETGLLVSDPADAAGELDRLLREASLHEHMAAKGLRYVREQHTDEAVGRMLLQALSEVKERFDRRG